jgi:hypothetical protein
MKGNDLIAMAVDSSSLCHVVSIEEGIPFDKLEHILFIMQNDGFYEKSFDNL